MDACTLTAFATQSKWSWGGDYICFSVRVSIHFLVYEYECTYMYRESSEGLCVVLFGNLLASNSLIIIKKLYFLRMSMTPFAFFDQT